MMISGLLNPVRKEAQRLRKPLAFFVIILLGGCGPTGVTLLKPGNLVNYQYVTCYAHKDDPSVLAECIKYYEQRGFVKEDQINMLQM